MIGNRYSAVHAAIVAALICAALAVLGGLSNGFDNWTVNALADERLSHPFLTHAGIRITQAGSAPMTLTLALLGATLLMWRGRLFDAAALGATVLGGRLMVEVLKQIIARPRPDLVSHAVTVQTFSFPAATRPIQ